MSRAKSVLAAEVGLGETGSAAGTIRGQIPERMPTATATRRGIRRRWIAHHIVPGSPGGFSKGFFEQSPRDCDAFPFSVTQL